MVYGVFRNVQLALKQRGGWKGLLDHMYTNGDYPFKFGTLMGSDAGGNKYFENRIDYPFGQHRWVEPGDRHNFDASSIPPEWNGWMCSMNDTTPDTESTYLENAKQNISPICHSDAPFDNNVGHQEKVFNFHHLHNQTSVRSRGYNIGNPIVGLPPGAPDAYYTQPGSQYNAASRKPFEFVGDLDEGKPDTVVHRLYKNQKWADRLTNEDEKVSAAKKLADSQKKMVEDIAQSAKRARKMRNIGSATML
jgi:NADH:ubiquinone oxidoreductase subunit